MIFKNIFILLDEREQSRIYQNAQCLQIRVKTVKSNFTATEDSIQFGPFNNRPFARDFQFSSNR